MSTTHPVTHDCIECSGVGHGHADAYRGTRDISVRIDCTECDGTGTVAPLCHVCDAPADLGHVEHVWHGRTVSRWLCERCHDELTPAAPVSTGRQHYGQHEEHGDDAR